MSLQNLIKNAQEIVFPVFTAFERCIDLKTHLPKHFKAVFLFAFYLNNVFQEHEIVIFKEIPRSAMVLVLYST